jgi:ATP-dependent Lon protease
MLREDAVQAVRDGKFHIYPVSTIEQGIEILTGIPAGKPNASSHYPKNSFNHQVQVRLKELANKVQAFPRKSKHSKATSNGKVTALKEHRNSRRKDSK